MFRKFNHKEIEELLKKAAQKSGEKPTIKPVFAVLLLKIQENWSQIAPEGLAKHSFPWKIEQEKIFIRADHGIFAQELKFQQQLIFQNINRLYRKKLSKINTHIGPLYSKNKTKDIMSRDSKMALKNGENPPQHENKKMLEELIQKLKQDTTNGD